MNQEADNCFYEGCVGKTDLVTTDRGWSDLKSFKPRNPLDLIAEAHIDTTVGVFLLSDNYSRSESGSWLTNTLFIDGVKPYVTALGTDQQQKVADASQWNFHHDTANLDTNLAPPLSRFIFLCAGTEWKNTIRINLGGESFEGIQLSFLLNAATRGDYRGVIPVLNWDGSWSGSLELHVVLKMKGQYSMGLRCQRGDEAMMYEMEWIVI